jgi:hypothetical protein
LIQALLFILILHLGVNFTGFALSGSQPAITTTLNSGITASDTTVPVTGSGVTGFPKAGWLFIQGEAIQYSDTTLACPSPYTAAPACFTGALRGQQNTIPSSHVAASTVYNEATGLYNDLSNFEERTSINDFGNVTTPWGAGLSLVHFLSHAATWDWPMFEGPFAVFRIFGAAFTIAIIIGLFVLLATILTNIARSVRP